MLDEIEALARAVPAVGAALAEVVSTGSGEALHLFVRPADSADVAEPMVLERLRRQLPPAAVPARVIVAHELPVNSSLKLLAPGSATTGPPPTRETPQAIAPAITAIAESILGRTLRATDNFFEAGFDSLSLLQFSVELSGLLQREIPAIMMFQYASLQRLMPRLAVPELAATRRAPAQAVADGGSVRDRRRQLRRSIARQLGGGEE